MTILQDQLSNSSVARSKQRPQERGFLARYFGIGEEDVKNAIPKSRWPYLGVHVHCTTNVAVIARNIKRMLIGLKLLVYEALSY